ncbi:PorP/SprF family type IX secretion system membrane protein [Fulvivirga sp. 29W222]|uniref:PorP/SprF family type IX secretion system membrane protein n=1 Tax=Fulvivirga marina TaxID=2494733 RepID=A0A937KB78_9BACT|nr:PorP/SprF family type IX secretion system membrane protein [Fulvivirga marina]MBL6445579.1 PorP/SprF family type IX secretion system membrane protein [Fulvivirga marina]
MGKFFGIVFLLLQAFLLHAQQIPVYNHYYNNPYLFNPAEVGSNGYLNFTLNHRQQWRGIEGAPVVSTLTFEAPFDYKQHAYGLTIRNYERGLITTNDLLATYAYTVYLTKVSKISFGLSAGVTSTDIDFDQIDDPDDPVLDEFLRNNIQPIANFGFKLKTKSGLNLGITIPKLFKPTIISTQDFQNYEFSPFDEILFSTYYKKRIDKKIVTRRIKGIRRRVAIEDAYAPLQMYLLYRYSKVTDERIEVLSTLHLHEDFWIGGGYRLNYGAFGLVGFNISSFSFAYAYEPASNLVDGYTAGTHELQLTINIGERKKLERTKPILRTIEKTETHRARYSVEDISEGGGEDKGSDRPKKYYVVIKTFKDFDSADAFVRRMKEERELYTNIFYNKVDNKYHVYTYQTFKLKEANEQKRALQELTKYKSVTIIAIEQ